MKPAVVLHPSTPRTEREWSAVVTHHPCTPRTEREQLLSAVPTPLRHVARGPVRTQRSASPMQRTVGRGGGRPASPSPVRAQIGDKILGVGPQTYSAGQLIASSRDRTRSTTPTSVRVCNPLRKAF